mmetsp:Transcript_19780/g.64302  ORF Transcript_19780/g.64302 Transcript_19780/m.64302 type:complete len:201 (+) Transcript_19780:90-692(+)
MDARSLQHLNAVAASLAEAGEHLKMFAATMAGAGALAVESKGPRVKKEKRKREGPPTAYNLYIRSRQSECKLAHPELKQTELMKIMAEEWGKSAHNPKSDAGKLAIDQGTFKSMAEKAAEQDAAEGGVPPAIIAEDDDDDEMEDEELEEFEEDPVPATIVAVPTVHPTEKKKKKKLDVVGSSDEGDKLMKKKKKAKKTDG